MKFLVVGLGSMGKRRIRCLLSLGQKDITGFDTRKDRCIEANERYGIKVLSDWDEVMSTPTDTWIISTPPDLHMRYAFIAAKCGKHFFTEAGITSKELPKLISTLRASRTVGVPSCSMRFFEGPKKLKKLLKESAIGQVLSFTYHWGQYLPSWHPWERYQDFYVSNRETGACREIVAFQLVWLVDIFGLPTLVSCMNDKISNLDTDIDDVYQILMKFDSQVLGHIMVDVVSQPAINQIRVCGSSGTIEFNQHENSLRLYQSNVEKWVDICIDRGSPETGYLYPEDPYIEEIEAFLSEIQSKDGRYPYSYEADFEVLVLLNSAEDSSIEGEHVQHERNSLA